MIKIKHSNFYTLLLCSIIWILSSCQTNTKNQKLIMTDDEIVNAMVQMYTANAAWNLNDISYQDSTREKYYTDISKLLGRPISEIKTDFETLLLMPDSLLVLQSRALDTLRQMQENSFNRPAVIKPEIN